MNNIKTKEEHLVEVKLIAESKGGKCLSLQYHNNKTYMEFVCSEEHFFKSRAHNIKTGYWCKQCAINKNAAIRRKTIKDMQELAATHNGLCLSTCYTGSHNHLRWQCGTCGHKWYAEPANIQQGTWCPKCGNKRANQNRKLTISEIQLIAKNRGGECLATKYINNNIPVIWKCSEGHKWPASVESIKRGSWCPRCAGKNKNIEDMIELAKEKGGTCLSDKYIDSTTELEWQCAKGHRWKREPKFIKRGNWCPQCAKDNKQKYYIEDMQKIATENGGECLSKEYTGSHKHLKWKCQYNHIFYLTPSKVINANQWCQQCSGYYTQEKCRYVFQILLNKEFKLNRTLLGGYELDGFNEDLQLAFEYNGKQHYQYDPYFHRDLDALKKI